jgi:hypothetical protein
MGTDLLVPSEPLVAGAEAATIQSQSVTGTEAHLHRLPPVDVPPATETRMSDQEGQVVPSGFKFEETADVPNDNVTAEEAETLSDNALLTCLKRQHGKAQATLDRLQENMHAFIVYFEAAKKRFKTIRSRDAQGRFIDEGRPTLAEAFAKIGLSFVAMKKRNERYVNELARLAAAAEIAANDVVIRTDDDSKDELVVRTVDSKSGEVVVEDASGVTSVVVAADVLKPDTPKVHTFKIDGVYRDPVTRKEYVYAGDGDLKIRPTAKIVAEKRKRDSEGYEFSNQGRESADEKSAQKSRRKKENEDRDKALIEKNKAEQQKKANKGKKTKGAGSDTRTSRAIKTKTFVTKRLENPTDGYLFGTFNTDDLNTPLSVYRTLPEAEAETARLNAKYAVKSGPLEPAVDELTPQAEALQAPQEVV